jgi:hypothetical protein
MNHQKHFRILAIAPSTRGFGFAVLEGLDMLADWGVKEAKGDKNNQSLGKVKELVALYMPDLIVLQDTSPKDCRRSLRIKTLTRRIISLASKQKIKVELFSDQHVEDIFFTDGRGTKYARAQIVAARFPEELGSRLPPKRKPWKSEDYRMAIFDAVALALMPRLMKRF